MNRNELNNLLNAILEIDNKEDLLNFLEGILTPGELDELPRRLEIVKMLKQGIPQREIADKLGVGVATITRGSKEIKRGKFRVVKPNN